MDKIAFFYELGYNMVKEAEEKEETILKRILSGTRATGGEMLDIYKSLFGAGAKGKGYFKNIAEIFGKAGLPAKILAPAVPLAALTGAGYGVYKATRKKSPKEKLLAALGLD